MPRVTELPADHCLLDLLERYRRVLLVGVPGSGKTTLAARAAASLANAGRGSQCLMLDPGSPGFGPPGAVSLGVWQDDQWQLQRLHGLCSLDAARFRLPLVEAARRLSRRVANDPLLIDAPGVVRGVAGAELLPALAEASGAEALVVVVSDGAPMPLDAECRAIGLPLVKITADPDAHSASRPARSDKRTQAWDAHLGASECQDFDLGTMPIVGTPPPRDVPDAWRGRQVALQGASGETLALGEVQACHAERLRICLRARQPQGDVFSLLIRDAQRGSDGRLVTARPPERPQPAADILSLEESASAVADGPRPSVRLGLATASLTNGVYGDPALHLRLRHQRRSLFFDLGDIGRHSSRLAHQVSDVFISHAHFDHIAGFMWLLRSRIGVPSPCRLVGPPGLASHIAGLVRGILWDRVGDKAPRFEVSELHGERLERYIVEAGHATPERLASRPANGGVVHEEASFRVRATTLDHGTPVLAFAFEPSTQLKVRKERLDERALTPGPWLGVLKRKVQEGDLHAEITLPDGRRQRVGELCNDLLMSEPGQRLAYATDFADTPGNRQRVRDLARGAHVLFCEASFREEQSDQAKRTGHLTASACGSIADEAQVGQLIPFHFSRRYGEDLRGLYAEIRGTFDRVWIPQGLDID